MTGRENIKKNSKVWNRDAKAQGKQHVMTASSRKVKQ